MPRLRTPTQMYIVIIVGFGGLASLRREIWGCVRGKKAAPFNISLIRHIEGCRGSLAYECDGLLSGIGLVQVGRGDFHE